MKATTKTLLFFWVVFFLVWVVRGSVFYTAVDLSIPDETYRLIFSDVVKFLVWVVPAVVYVLWLERANPLTSMKISTPVDKRGLVIGIIVSLLYFAAILISEKLKTGRTLAPLFAASTAAWLTTLAQVFISPIFEEIMFRGFVLPHLSSRMEFLEANILQAVFFTAMHWPNWVTVNGLQFKLLGMSVSVLVIGLLLGWLSRRTNSIWPSVAVHIINNFLVGFLG
ncbi:MAG: CPBP family intramembrane glutamic endopeptidase [Anaerolineales bacterium]